MSAASSKSIAPSSASDHALALHVGGFTPLSLSDWPGQLAVVVFCQGCPWRCGYCHNPHLIPPRAATSRKWQDVLAFLERRRGLLDAVVFSGGEPTLQRDLPEAMRAARALGFRIGLHTAGLAPRRLAAALPLSDWIAMDIKAPFDDYACVTGVAGGGNAARESARMILASGIAHEFRTTVHPELLPPPALERLAHTVAGLGVRHYVLQQFRARGCASPHLAGFSNADYPGPALSARLAGLFQTFAVRPAQHGVQEGLLICTKTAPPPFEHDRFIRLTPACVLDFLSSDPS